LIILQDIHLEDIQQGQHFHRILVRLAEVGKIHAVIRAIYHSSPHRLKTNPLDHSSRRRIRKPTIWCSTIDLIRPRKEPFTQGKSIENNAPLPHDLLLLVDDFQPFFVAHGRCRPQHEIVVLPPQMNEVYPVLALVVVPDRNSGYNRGNTTGSLEGGPSN
jgi:hypothetical protein